MGPQFSRAQIFGSRYSIGTLTPGVCRVDGWGCSHGGPDGFERQPATMKTTEKIKIHGETRAGVVDPLEAPPFLKIGVNDDEYQSTHLTTSYRIVIDKSSGLESLKLDPEGVYFFLYA